MAFNETYRRQVALLLRTMPFIAQETSFALKRRPRSAIEQILVGLGPAS